MMSLDFHEAEGCTMVFRLLQASFSLVSLENQLQTMPTDPSTQHLLRVSNLYETD